MTIGTVEIKTYREYKTQTFRGKEFKVIKGETHPEYSYVTFEEDECEFRDKYWNVKSDDVVIDIGASYGAYSISACAVGAKVISIEPEKTVFDDLVHNIKLNNFEADCAPIKLALWSSDKVINMKDYAPHWPSATISGDYNTTTLNQIVDSLQLKKIDWIKIDVEGAEEHVIIGGLESIKKFHPKLIIECHIFLDPELKTRVKLLLKDDYDFEEIDRDPCVFLYATPKQQNKLEKKHMKIAVILGAFSIGTRPLDFHFENIWISSRGLTGTDLATVMISKELQKQGHDVSLFTVHAQPDHKPIVWENVKLFNVDERFSVIDDTYDAIISINEPDVFRNLPTKALRICWQFLNDFSYCQPGFDDFVDLWLSPCSMHMEYLKKQSPHPEKWQVLALGCDPSWYEDKRVLGRVIWTSSCDRGLHWLLSQWPRIKSAVPEATLKIFYHFNYGSIESIEPNSTVDHPHVIELGQRVRYMKEMIARLKPLGVEQVGSVSRKDIAKEISEASVLAFSVDTVAFSEGFSVSTMESHAGFTVPVITDADCLGSIYKDSGAIVIKSPVRDRLDDFTNAVIKALTDKSFADATIEKCRAFADKHTWNKISQKMEMIIQKR